MVAAPSSTNSTDVKLVRSRLTAAFTCRLNWQLHFGETPKWSNGVKFLLADISPVARDGDRSEVVLTGDAAAVAQQLTAEAAHVDRGRFEGWVKQLRQKVGDLASYRSGCTGWLPPLFGGLGDAAGRRWAPLCCRPGLLACVC